MYPPPSDRFLPAHRESYHLVTVVELHRTDGTVVELDHTGGSVTVDRGAAVRRTCSVTATDTSLIPTTPTEQVAIYGARLRILRGLRYPTGQVETVPVFYGRVDSVSGDPDTGPVTIAGSGLEAVISDDAFQEPYSTRGGTAASTAIRGLIQRSLPDAVVVFTAVDQTIGTRTWDAQSDPWAAVQECATAVGAEVYFDADGQCIVAPLPDVLSVAPVWDVNAGPGGALISGTRGYSRDGMYNVVIASGENTEDDTPPVTATAEDDDPTSPTYVGGPFGRVPQFYSSATIITQNQAQGTANTLLKSAVKPNATADISSLPNPCLEPGDVLRVAYANGDRELHQAQSFSLPLDTSGDFALATIGAKEDS